MKAERRHQLQQNSLASALEHLPVSVRKYGAQVLLGIIVVALIFVLIRYRTHAAEARHHAALERLDLARKMIDQLRSPALMMLSQEQIASTRKDVWAEADATLAGIQSDSPQVRAEVLVARGNLAWLMANTPELPGATTRPALKLDADRDTLLSDAQKSYDEVLSKYLSERPSASAAHFGLAAIAENRGQWDSAADHYSTLARDPTTPAAFRTQAMIRLQMLSDIQNPMLIVDESGLPVTRPSTQASSFVGPIAPATQPATAPATQPAH